MRVIAAVIALAASATPALSCNVTSTLRLQIEMPEAPVSVTTSPDPNQDVWPRAATNAIVHGYTHVRPEAAADLRTHVRNHVAGGVCNADLFARLLFRFDGGIRIVIRDRYRGKPCNWDAVYAHELDHARVALQARAIAAERIRQHYDGRSVLTRFNSADESRAFLTDLRAQIARDALALYRQAADPANAAIDTPASYDALRQSCPNW